MGKNQKSAKSTARPPRISNKAKSLKTNDQSVTSVEHYNAVLIEDMRSQMGVVIEYMGSVKDELIKRMDERFSQQAQEIGDIKKIVTHHSQMHASHNERFDRIEHVLLEHSQRFKSLEGKFDALAETVERHDITLKRLTA